MPYSLPADFLTGPGNVWVLSSPATGRHVTDYLQLQVPFAGHVAAGPGVGVCDSL